MIFFLKIIEMIIYVSIINGIDAILNKINKMRHIMRNIYMKSLSFHEKPFNLKENKGKLAINNKLVTKVMTNRNKLSNFSLNMIPLF